MGNKNFYLTLSVFGVIALILIAFCVWPLFNSIRNDSLDLVSAKNSIATISAQLVETAKFKERYQSYRPNLDRLSQFFVDPKNPVDFIKFLESSAANSNLSPQISLVKATDAQQSVVFRVYLKGAFTGVTNFLSTIESGPYLIYADDLSVEGLQSQKVDAALTINVFTKK